MGSRYSHVFAPIRIRGIDFKNRVTLAPTTPVLSTEDGIITHEFVDWFRMFARGGACVLYLGNCSVDLRENQDQSFQLDLGTDRGILPMTWYADMARQYGCHASFEINHAGEGVAFETFGRPSFSSSSFISEDEVITVYYAVKPAKTTEAETEPPAETLPTETLPTEESWNNGWNEIPETLPAEW